MSIVDTFDGNSPEILKPSHLATKIEDFPATVIITFDSRLTGCLSETYGNDSVEVMAYLNPGVKIPIYRVKHKGLILGIYTTIMGAAATVALMEEIIAMGAQKILIFGTCGIISDEITSGDFIIPTEAYRDEGTSYHYAPASDTIKITTAGKLGEIFTQLGVPFVYGKTWTTDALYRETADNVKKRRNDGFSTVEMECASVMAAGRFRNVEVYQYLCAADSLAGEEWQIKTPKKPVHRSPEEYLRILVNIALKL